MERTFVYLCALVATVSGSRLLLIPMDHHAHVNFFSIIGQELQSRGHQVDVLVANRSVHLPKKAGLGTVIPPYTQVMAPNQFENTAFGNTSLFTAAGDIAALTKRQARDIFGDKDLLKRLISNNYDIALIDGVDFGRIMYLIPYYLDVKYITINARHDPWAARVPALPSVEGMLPVVLLDENSSFLHRLLSLFMHIASYMVLTPPSYVTGLRDDLFTELVPNRPNIGFERLFQGSEMFLINMDIICLDSHRPSAPHYQFIGGLGSREAQPLPDDLEKFMSSSKDGAIVLTFGSGIKNIPMDILQKLLTAFSGLKQNVIMRHVGEQPSVIPKNVLIQSWMPQNDLIAHPNTKLFITHTGNNGQLEGVYHGVPMLMMPFLGDQMYNADRAIRRGYGLRMDPHNFSAQELKDNIMKIINDPTYRNKIKKCSNILRSLPSPQNKAAFWIEHVLKFGSSHLRPYYMDMPLWRFFMLDIIGFLIACDVIFLLLLRWCCIKCRKVKSSKSKTE